MGKRIVGWDETLDGGERLPKDAIVHWWRNRTRGEAPALEALRRGHEIVCSPNSFTYVSFPVNPNSQYIVERTLDLEKAYSYDYAFDGASAEERSRVLGIEACLWGETTLAREADQFAFPRLLACAETQWSPLQGKNFDEFEERVLRHYRRLDHLGIQYGAAYRTSSGARQALGEKK